MISVPSRLLQLNGSSLLLIGLLLLFCQCNTTKKTTKTNPDRNTEDPRGNPPLDTIAWTESDINDVIEVDPDLDDDVLIEEGADEDIPSLTVVLPLNAEQIDLRSGVPSAKNEALIQYYTGWKLALDRMDASGEKFNVTIFDAHEDIGHLEQVLNQNGKQKSQYLFGGLGREQVEYMAQYASTHQMTYISGWQSNSKFIGENENYIQLSPGFQAHVNAILKHALGQFEPDEIILFGSRQEQSRIDEINRLYQELTGSEDLLETFVVESMNELELLEMEDWQETEDRKVFIVPITKDYNLIHDFFRFLDFNLMHERSIVYGITDWNDELLYDHLNNFDVRLAAFWNPGVQVNYDDFVEDFFQVTGTLPHQKAYEGYGHAMLMKKMIDHMEENDGDFKAVDFEALGMHAFIVDHNQIEFPGTDRPIEKSYFENRAVQLLGFKEYQYHLLPR